MFFKFLCWCKVDSSKIIRFAGLKLLILPCLVFSTLTVCSQSRYDWKSQIDYLVEQTDSLSMKSQKTFYLPKIVRVDRSFKNDLEVKETWNYTLNRGRKSLLSLPGQRKKQGKALHNFPCISTDHD